MATMARLQFGRLTEAWKGEATDFTPLLAEQLDAVGSAIAVDLTTVGESEVQTTGGRRIDIVAQGEDGSEFVIENQYGRADHDHLTRGLAYAVARRARGLVVIAEEHRDEFRAVAQSPSTTPSEVSRSGSSRRRRCGSWTAPGRLCSPRWSNPTRSPPRSSR
jgi:hypothetical protein